MTAEISYPETRRDDVVEDHFGTKVADPYRWLEDADSADTADWVRRQNAVTRAHLEGLPHRQWFSDTMSAILHRPRAGIPEKKSGWYFVSRNDGSQNQDVWFVADSLDGLLAGGRVILDPNVLSADGTTSVSRFTVSPDGRFLAYAVSEGGSDWHTFRIREVATGEDADDVVDQTKFSLPSWLPDSRSYLYVRFPDSGRATGTTTTALGGGRLMLHRVGTDQADDELVLHFPENDQLLPVVQISEDHQYAVASIFEGTENRNRVWVYRIVSENGVSRLSEPIKLFDEPVAEFGYVAAGGQNLYFFTDLDAPRGRVVEVNLDAYPGSGLPDLVEVVPPGGDTIAGVAAAADALVTISLADAQPVVALHRHGQDPQRLDLRAGAIAGWDCREGDEEGFLGLSTVTTPIQAYGFSASTGALRDLSDLVPAGESTFVPPEITTERQRATSADGTQVPYFLIRPADTPADGPRPTLLYGYGGFKIPVLANYSPGFAGWLAAGGVVAIANLRGGGEYGTEWYEDGRLANKQHVFDDFIAVAEHLTETGVTTPAQLAIHGRSNGGLLVGAVMTQRPDLAAVAIPGVGVLDILRFHKFTIGAAWISDYGNPDVESDFQQALKYSPLHNVRAGARYPATLVLTGDHDDRVVPLHSHKFTAALQAAQAADAPVLTRIETSTGHGMGKPTAMVAAEWADALAFAAHHTGLVPPG
jgi:prolyl oligopeptidase